LGELSFHPASAGDVGEIARLINLCYRGDVSREGWTSEADLLEGARTNEDEIRSLVEREGSAILACVDRGEIIGSVHLERDGRDCYLGLLVVRPDLQARGIGKRLMAAAEEFALDAWSPRRMRMTVISSRVELIAFYERRGYRRTGRTEPFPADGSHGTPRTQDLRFEVLEKTL